ncbi:MAG: hypothetical protein H5T86_07010 [Armatimonadetes bacterium]|nr:hypothetical protein [Armatimonadota bacterium]
MGNIEAHNLTEIERLNQRGGRTLSIADLCAARTLNSEVAAFFLCAVREGASILTGARRGGAGKSTLLANILCMLPPGERIVTVSSRAVIARALEAPPTGPECVLSHEIGSGHWYGYIWGDAVGQFFRLMDTGRRIASCIHADTLEELEDILASPPLLVPPEYINNLGLVAFIDFVGRGAARRVTYVYGHAPGGELRLALRWRASDDTHDLVSPLEAFGIDGADFDRAKLFFDKLLAAGPCELTDMRRQIAEFYLREGW